MTWSDLESWCRHNLSTAETPPALNSTDANVLRRSESLVYRRRRLPSCLVRKDNHLLCFIGTVASGGLLVSNRESVYVWVFSMTQHIEVLTVTAVILRDPRTYNQFLPSAGRLRCSYYLHRLWLDFFFDFRYWVWSMNLGVTLTTNSPRPSLGVVGVGRQA